MSTASHVPGSQFFDPSAIVASPATTRRAAQPRRKARTRWVPISHDEDPLSRERRLRHVEQDIILHTSGDSCTGCGQSARLSGGEGCLCHAAGTDMEKRCIEAAERVRLAGDPWRNAHPADRTA